MKRLIMSGNHLMVIDGQHAHQVVVNHSQVAYEQPHAAGIVAIPQQGTQTVFYMDASQNVGTELTQVEGVELQPIVLNHSLGNQISLIHNPTKSFTAPQQQFNVMSQTHVLETKTDKLENRPQNIFAPRQSVEPLLPTLESLVDNKDDHTQSNFLPPNQTESLPREVNKHIKNNTEEYKSIVIKQQQRQAMMFQKRLQEKEQQSSNTSSQEQQLRNADVKPTYCPKFVHPTLISSNGGTSKLQKTNNHNYLIVSPKLHANKVLTKRPLPSCVTYRQIKEIIDKGPIADVDLPDSIRMLVMLANGEQRLITFTLPGKECTIREILEQVGVVLQPDTYVDVTETNSDGVNYVVTVGVKQHEMISRDKAEICAKKQDTPRKPEETTPVEPIDQPRYIEGKMALCGYCGILSYDFNKCTRCKTKLPDNVKAIPVLPSRREEPMKATTVATDVSLSNSREVALRKKAQPKTRSSESETVVLTLSSDDEDDTSSDKATEPSVDINLQNKADSSGIMYICKEPTISDIKKSSAGPLGALVSKVYPTVYVQCRTVRIGSYKTTPKKLLRVDYSSTTISVASLTCPEKLVTFAFNRRDIVKVLACFDKILPIVFYYLKANAGQSIREQLGMVDDTKEYFDPLSENESHRRITLLPESVPEGANKKFEYLYASADPSANLLEEITWKEANEILVKSCPKETAIANMISGTKTGGNRCIDAKPLLVYPPEGKIRITIRKEDYLCLASDQFLNDVIIDFYLKYLVDKLSPEQQERIHVFSTFFYKRLTTKPGRASRKSQPTELDPALSAAETRHARVKNWTKNIDVFQKDYIVVPINESCHWFLAIICFPGLDGTQTMDGIPIKIEHASVIKGRRSKKTTVSIKREEVPFDECLSDKDEAEGDESELETDEADDATPPQTITTQVNRPPIKQPCILIFDSLSGTGRSRVVATLRDYLTCEYKAKYDEEKVFNKDVIKGACPRVPQQTNFTDCGLYLLQYVEHFFFEPIKDFYLPIKGLANWFDELIVTRKREEICMLIKELMLQYKYDVERLPEMLLPTKDGVVIDQFGEHEGLMDDLSDNEEFPSENYALSVDEKNVSSDSNKNAKSLTDSEKVEIGDRSEKPFKSDLNMLSVPKLDVGSKDALSYLKSKRIERRKNVEVPLKKPKISV